MTSIRTDGRPRATRPSALQGPMDSLKRTAGKAAAGAARRPGLVLAAAALLGGGGLFGWNALTQQPTRHPAPLFAGAKEEAVKPEPPRRPDLASALVPLPTPKPDTHLAAQQTGTITPPAKPSGTDGIGSLIRSNAEPAAARPAEPPKPDAKVASAQKALTKLGYGPLKPDGVLGATTRNALLRFEREKNLPSTGAVAGRTAKQLATLSGLPI